MKLNTDKCYLLSSGRKHEHMRAKIGHDIIWESNIVKQLGVTIYNHLIFDNYVINICSKANSNLKHLVANLFSFQTKLILFKAFYESQFKYFPLVWMFSGKQTNNKMNKKQEGDLKIVYNDTVTPFQDLLIKDRSFTIH